MVSILLLLELAARKYPAVRLRQVEKDTAAALGLGFKGKLEHLPGRKVGTPAEAKSSSCMFFRYKYWDDRAVPGQQVGDTAAALRLGLGGKGWRPDEAKRHSGGDGRG